MTETRQDIIARIRACLPFGADPSFDIKEESVLADLGVSSLHLITMLLTLQRQYALDFDRTTSLGIPATVGDLVTLIEKEMLAG